MRLGKDGKPAALASYEEVDQGRVDRLVSTFNGAIKYQPMLKDHPDWTDDQCLEFARKWHAEAMHRLTHSGLGPNGVYLHGPRHKPWNEAIPYCRNIPTAEMLKEAGK